MASSDGRFSQGTVVRVPFPYTDAETRQHRPALVVAFAESDADPFLIWVVMITSAANRGWPGDIEIPDAAGAGLPAPSLVRTAKIATIEVARAEPRGRIDPATLAAVRGAIGERLGLLPAGS